jgi:6-phosphogluconolactonase
MIVVVMGATGTGKTTVGAMLADALHCEYVDADTLHTSANIAKMSHGDELTDADREPWLMAVQARIRDAFERGRTLVVGCSALRQSYRETLARGVSVIWVYLRGELEVIRERLSRRAGHFAGTRLLESQLATLEEPYDAIVMDIDRAPDAIVQEVLVRIRGTRSVRVVQRGELGFRSAAEVAATIRDVVARTGRFSLVLSGGDTPRAMHLALAAHHRDDTPWSDVHVFWSDERYVPSDDARSNYGMARETLLDHVPLPAANVHPMPTSFDDPAVAARAYEDTLADYFRDVRPSFDLAILGIGVDGHTASLFPHGGALHERRRTVVHVRADAEPPLRLTLTLPVLLACARNWFLVEGPHKAETVRAVLSGTIDPHELPSAALLRARGEVMWWLDPDAAAQLGPEPGGHAKD